MSETHFAGIDFAVGVVRGVRSWDVNDEGVLSGVVYHQAWVAGENHALCRKEPDAAVVPYYPGIMVPRITAGQRALQIPERGHMFECQCGFYAFYDGSNDYFKGDYSQTARVTGVIEGYGEVLVGTRGFRCTRARIVALYVARRYQRGQDGLDMIRANYPDVPLFDSFAAMIAEFPEEDGGAREQYAREEQIREEQAREAARAQRQADAATRAEHRAQAVMDDDGGRPAGN